MSNSTINEMKLQTSDLDSEDIQTLKNFFGSENMGDIRHGTQRETTYELKLTIERVKIKESK